MTNEIKQVHFIIFGKAINILFLQTTVSKQHIFANKFDRIANQKGGKVMLMVECMFHDAFWNDLGLHMLNP
jgi:hypothetical protein